MIDRYWIMIIIIEDHYIRWIKTFIDQITTDRKIMNGLSLITNSESDWTIDLHRLPRLNKVFNHNNQ